MFRKKKSFLIRDILVNGGTGGGHHYSSHPHDCPPLVVDTPPPPVAALHHHNNHHHLWSSHSPPLNDWSAGAHILASREHTLYGLYYAAVAASGHHLLDTTVTDRPTSSQSSAGISGGHPSGGRSVSGGDVSSRKARRNRTVFTELQLMGLERRFDSQKYLSTPDRAELARALGLTQLQVKTWYQNRRMKWKKQVMQAGCTVPPTKPKGRPKKNSIPSYGVLDSTGAALMSGTMCADPTLALVQSQRLEATLSAALTGHRL